MKKGETRRILIFNVGSLTLKYAFFENGNLKEKNKVYRKDYLQTVSSLLKKFRPNVIVHRVVHGGEINKPTIITRKVIKEIKRGSEWAPLHNPNALKVINLCKKVSKHTKQIAIFDTGFFADLPEKARVYALPWNLSQKYNLFRRGFHGLNHEYIAKKFPDKNIISCHLGAGCSIAAISKGKPLDVSMGLTPLEGVIMATRSGSIDPGIILWLIKKFGIKKAEKILNEKSGLYGITGNKNVKKIFDEKIKKRNAFALEMFCYNVAKQICAYQAALQKIDIVAFSGGIGEANEYIRNKICSYLPFKYKLAVVPTNEEERMLKKVEELLNQKKAD